ncbi:hypothetical protein HDC30_002676 [Pseudomonas sp. JAI115]|uniref:TniQ family protein n=1 Tax=Pseudomonas sp. JAI115 TaxID=2723061 RepID=UPI00160FD088|nr:TniQ family protein [Pseudomonas sp. JAI115]MBB6155453.1 hypothetical protein [Pseudomonas sp. JAI115]
MQNDIYADLLALEASVMEARAAESRIKAKSRMQRAFDHLAVPQVDLLLKSNLQPWEGLDSLLFRVAKLNHLLGISQLKIALDMPNGSFYGQIENRNSQLQKCTGSTAEALLESMPVQDDAGMVRLGGHEFTARTVSLKTQRICPLCIRAYGYARVYWAFAPLAVCEEHGCYLWDQCPTCYASLGDNRPELGRCRCGTRFDDFPSMAASALATALASLIASLYKRHETLSVRSDGGLDIDRLASLGLNDLLKLIMFLGAISSDRKGMSLSLNRRVVSMGLVRQQFERAATALSDWPNGMFAILRRARVFTSWQETHNSVYGSLVHVHDLAMDKLDHCSFKLISEGFSSFLSTPQAWREDEFEEPQR